MVAIRRPRTFDGQLASREVVEPVRSTISVAARRIDSLSIIVPTRNEAQNVETLLDKIGEALEKSSIEVIFVDDSTDNTVEVIRELSDNYPFGVRVIARPPERRNGLGKAVVEGFQAAGNDWICVMDGDLQHPPSVVPQLLAQARSTGADLVMGSRLAPGGDAGGLGRFRTFVSVALAKISQMFFMKTLGKVSDPLTGLFLVRRESIDAETLDPPGFKILLEILIRHPSLRVSEVPFHFESRVAGESKANGREVLLLGWQMTKLQLVAQARLLKFLTVGTTGLLVNNLLMALFTELFGFFYMVSAVLATLGSTLWNFSGTEFWVFRDRQQGGGQISGRFISFLAMNGIMLAIRGPFLALLVSLFGMHYLVANFLTLVLMTLLRFSLSDRLIWRKQKTQPEKASATTSATTSEKTSEFNYNIHDIVRIRSAKRLPELGYFLTNEPVEADLVVRVVGNPKAHQQADSICYDEVAGRFGFSIVINRSEELTEIFASRLIGLSPHVLYTNVVEPLLRWTLVRKGYALLHGACVQFGDESVFVTARTDTGKTTTILRTMRNNMETSRFLSDDMLILSGDGTVYNYPKPLTISQHTVQAIGGAPLTRKEWMMLSVQSRLHSRGGRRIGMAISTTAIGAATLNAMVQMLIPPPKYMVDRLLPGAQYADTGRIDHIVIIERGPDDEDTISEAELVDTLVANAEDAYGFPPYPVLADKLSSWNGQDLHDVEAELVSAAVKGLTGLRLVRSNYDWHARLPLIVDIQPDPGVDGDRESVTKRRESFVPTPATAGD